MLTLNTNLSSLVAQTSLKTSTNKLNQAIERMTTGFKVNHASDNTANYSIITNMTTKINAYMVAEDNAAMGLDLISTAEGTLEQIQDKLERLRALQEQASNGTYGEESLQAINKEVNAIVDEIERLYSTAEYNGINLFSEENIFNQPPNEVTTWTEYQGNYLLYKQSSTPGPDEFVEISFSDGTQLFYAQGVVLASTRGIYYSNLSIPSGYTYSEAEGCFMDSSGNAMKLIVNHSVEAPVTYEQYGVATTVQLPALIPKVSDITIQCGIMSSESSQISFNTSFALSGIENLRNIGLDNADYLAQVDTILSSVSEKQTEYGAVSNRLESVLDEIQTQYDNLVSSRSTLRDADIAEVSATYIQQQILQQASATLLATANQSPALALQLL